MLILATVALVSFGLVIFVFYTLRQSSKSKEPFIPFILENIYSVIALGAMTLVMVSIPMTAFGYGGLPAQASGVYDLAFGPAGFAVVIFAAIAAWFLKRKSRKAN